MDGYIIKVVIICLIIFSVIRYVTEEIKKFINNSVKETVEKIHHFNIVQRVKEIISLYEDESYFEADFIKDGLIEYYSEFCKKEELPKAMIWINYFSAMILNKVDDPEEGIEFLKKAEEEFNTTSKDEIFPNVLIYEIYLCYGKLYLQNQKFEKSERYLKKSLSSIEGSQEEINAQSIEVYRIMGVCKGKMKQYEELLPIVNNMVNLGLKDLSEYISYEIVFTIFEFSIILNDNNEFKLSGDILNRASDFIDSYLTEKPFYQDIKSSFSEFEREKYLPL